MISWLTGISKAININQLLISGYDELFEPNSADEP